MSSTFRATISQPRSLLSIARLNIARSRVLPSNSSLLRIDQMYFGLSGGLAPVSFPLFQAKRPVVLALGQKRTLTHVHTMSALPPKADISRAQSVSVIARRRACPRAWEVRQQ